jgi:phosphatidylinositol 3-kinase
MHLPPYQVLPISRTFGLCEFIVGAKAISKVLAQNNNRIEDFFVAERKEECREVFKKSAAAYTVISYVLGVGDRHLDNLLMTANGNFFHVDFGFMFGQDPKPLPCPVRVAGEMVAAFDPEGAEQRNGYFEFLWHCEVIYNAIRRRADEFCCLVALMAPAELPHLPQGLKEISRILLDRLHLELTEKGAGRLIVAEIEKSVAALLPWIFEALHSWATG